MLNYAVLMPYWVSIVIPKHWLYTMYLVLMVGFEYAIDRHRLSQ